MRLSADDTGSYRDSQQRPHAVRQLLASRRQLGLAGPAGGLAIPNVKKLVSIEDYGPLTSFRRAAFNTSCILRCTVTNV